jgi:serine/threonine-protein kinase
VLVLSHYLDSRYAARLLEEVPARAGYLLKDRVSEVAVVSDALRRIDEGECVIDPTIVSRLVARTRARGPLDVLTEREAGCAGPRRRGSLERLDRREAVAVAQDGRRARLADLPQTRVHESPEDHRRVLAVFGVPALRLRAPSHEHRDTSLGWAQRPPRVIGRTWRRTTGGTDR